MPYNTVKRICSNASDERRDGSDDEKQKCYWTTGCETFGFPVIITYGAVAVASLETTDPVRTGTADTARLAIAPFAVDKLKKSVACTRRDDRRFRK